MTQTQISWDDAIASNDYVNLKENEQKTISITHWCFKEVEKFNKKEIEFQSDCVVEDKDPCEKQFTTTSKRLLKKLRPILEPKDVNDVVTVSITKVGDKFKTQYAVKEQGILKEE